MGNSDFYPLMKPDLHLQSQQNFVILKMLLNPSPHPSETSALVNSSDPWVSLTALVCISNRFPIISKCLRSGKKNQNKAPELPRSASASQLSWWCNRKLWGYGKVSTSSSSTAAVMRGLLPSHAVTLGKLNTRTAGNSSFTSQHWVLMSVGWVWWVTSAEVAAWVLARQGEESKDNRLICLKDHQH